MEITLHTGLQSDRNTVHIDWHDHNNVKHLDKLEINVLSMDKPRTIEIKLNRVVIATLRSE
jgi:hypothetical protein